MLTLFSINNLQFRALWSKVVLKTAFSKIHFRFQKKDIFFVLFSFSPLLLTLGFLHSSLSPLKNIYYLSKMLRGSYIRRSWHICKLEFTFMHLGGLCFVCIFRIQIKREKGIHFLRRGWRRVWCLFFSFLVPLFLAECLLRNFLPATFTTRIGTSGASCGHMRQFDEKIPGKQQFLSTPTTSATRIFNRDAKTGSSAAFTFSARGRFLFDFSDPSFTDAGANVTGS